ncbi:hypothetical protein BaRGS_00019886, partial [Batillaria attramentaria]
MRCLGRFKGCNRSLNIAGAVRSSNAAKHPFAMMAAYSSDMIFLEYLLLVLLAFLVQLTTSSRGMTVRNFHGIESLQEVECWGGALGAEVTLYSLKIFTIPGQEVVAFAQPFTNNCVTFAEFSSCSIDTSDTRKSRVRVLVPDLEDGESRTYGCNATSFKSFDHYKFSTWSLVVTGK